MSEEFIYIKCRKCGIDNPYPEMTLGWSEDEACNCPKCGNKLSYLGWRKPDKVLNGCFWEIK